jgi:hypothetical protein
MDKNNNFNQQPWSQFIDPKKTPKKKNNRWIIWVGISLLAFIGIASVAGYYAMKAGRKMGEFANKGMNAIDSLSKETNDSLYYSIYNQLGQDSISKEYKVGMDEFKSSTDSIYLILNGYHDGFRDTLIGTGGLVMMDKRWSENYFIKTGRALKLKNSFTVYRNNLIHSLPPTEQDSSLYSYLVIDEMQKSMPGFMKNVMSWENIYFNQPPMNVKVNFSTLRIQLKSFQEAILNRWQHAIDGIPKS